MAKLLKQLWYCDGCGNHGAVDYHLHEEMYSVIAKIEQAHHSLVPNCSADIEGIRAPQNQAFLDDLIRLHEQRN